MGPKKKSSSVHKKKDNKSEAENGSDSDEEQPDMPLLKLSVFKPTVWIDFLRSPEKGVVLKSLDKLYEAIRNYPGLRKKLLDKNVLNQIIRLIYSPETLIKAFSLKLFGELLKNKYNLRLNMKKMKKLVIHSMTVLKRSRYMILHEFTSLVLSLLTFIPKLRIFMVMYCKHWAVFFERLESTDPDVINNTLLLLYNLVRDKYCGQILVNQECFSFNAFFPVMESDYVQIQTRAVNLVNYLIRRNIKELNEIFLQGRGLLHMFNFIYEYKWRDHHSKIFQIIRILSKNDKVINYYKDEWIMLIIEYIGHIENDDLIYDDLLLILVLCNNINMREKLIESGIYEEIKNLLEIDNSINNKCASIRILSKLALNNEGIKPIISDNTVNKLFSIINNDECDGILSDQAMECILNLCGKDDTVLYKNETLFFINEMIKWSMKALILPNNFVYNLLSTINILAENPIIKMKLINEDLFISLFKLIQVNSQLTDTFKIRIIAANIIYLLSENIVNILGKRLDKYYNNDIIIDILSKANNVKLIEIISNIILMLIKNSERLTLKFIEHGFLKWYVTNEKIWFPSLIVENLIHKFFQNFLPIKFEYMGFLDFVDQTKSGFYCHRGSPNNNIDFPMLNTMIKYNNSNGHLVYVFIYDKIPFNEELIEYESSEFNEISLSKSDEEFIEKYIDTSDSITSKKSDYSKSVKSLKLKKSKININENENRPSTSRVIHIKDKTMTRYVEELMISSKNCFSLNILELDWTIERINIITSIITNAMGSSYEDIGQSQNLILHINELKLKLNTSAIPLGVLEIGYKFERALLFKCLADVLGLPCRLVRGSKGIAWNEVCIMERTLPKCDLPLSRLISTHVVDLWCNPGKLLPIDSVICKEYCGPTVHSLINMRPRYNVDILKKLVVKNDEKIN